MLSIKIKFLFKVNLMYFSNPFGITLIFKPLNLLVFKTLNLLNSLNIK